MELGTGDILLKLAVGGPYSLGDGWTPPASLRNLATRVVYLMDLGLCPELEHDDMLKKKNGTWLFLYTKMFIMHDSTSPA